MCSCKIEQLLKKDQIMPINDKNTSMGLPALGNIQGVAPVASFNISQVEHLIASKGFLAFHLAHHIDPDRHREEAGLNISKDGNERIFNFHDCRPLLIVPQQFSYTEHLQNQGMSGVGQVTLNVAGQYLDEKKGRVFISPNDLIIMNPTFTLQYRQIFTYGDAILNKLDCRIQGIVEYCATKDQRFEQNVDFEVVDGKLSWIGQKPQEKQVVSIVYHYSPIYTANYVPHFLRIIPSNPQGFVYAPQLIMASQSTVKIDQWAFDPFELDIIKNYEKYLPHG
jgi:hypothetical protein